MMAADCPVVVCGPTSRAQASTYTSSGSMTMAPEGHSATHSPQPLQ